MSADIATLLDVEEDWDDDPLGRFNIPFLFENQTRYLPALAFWVGNIPIIILPGLKFGMERHSNTGAVDGFQVRTLAIYGAVANVIVGCTSTALTRDAVRHYDFRVLRPRGVRRLRTRDAVTRCSLWPPGKESRRVHCLLLLLRSGGDSRAPWGENKTDS